MSSFTWLDSSEHKQRQMLDAIKLFQEKETRDELGIGTVRDAFADLLFPGTSTIQTRARYFLFIPWIFAELERKKVPSAKIVGRARRDEVNLINALAKNGVTDGLIGINARASLKRLPSAIYWQGLGAWGLRLFDGSRGAYNNSLDLFYAENRRVLQFRRENQREDEEMVELQMHLYRRWHPGAVALRPDRFPEGATFELTAEEAEYLRERILSSQPETLLAFLAAETNIGERSRFPWQHSAWVSFPAHLQEQLIHARLFSLLIHGAALLYNLMLAQKAEQVISPERREQVEHYHDRLDDWVGRIMLAERELALWDWKDRFWEIVFKGNQRVPLRTQRFINTWLGMVLGTTDANTLAEDVAARALIRDRERRLKRGLARLENPRALELWSGAAGTGRLAYRWGGTQTLLFDILEGLLRA